VAWWLGGVGWLGGWARDKQIPSSTPGRALLGSTWMGDRLWTEPCRDGLLP